MLKIRNIKIIIFIPLRGFAHDLVTKTPVLQQCIRKSQHFAKRFFCKNLDHLAAKAPNST